MNSVLVYSRSKIVEPMGEQTANLLSEQLQHVGINAEVSHTLNLPRLLLNPYNTVHIIVENLPLSTNEIFHLSVCKALGKSTVLSVLNSDNKLRRGLLDYFRPDAFSVSQTNHLKLYRNISGNKFIFSALPKSISSTRKNKFKPDAFLVPLQANLDEVFEFKIDSNTYFDGRKLLKYHKASQLRKRWSELANSGKIKSCFHLILSDNKLNQLLSDESIVVVLADPRLQNTELAAWLGNVMNKNNLVVLNDFQATGFSNYWTSGYNSFVVSAQDWIKQIEQLPALFDSECKFICTTFVSSELFEPTVNELSRLYSKLWQQKTSLLTSRSVKL